MPLRHQDGDLLLPPAWVVSPALSTGRYGPKSNAKRRGRVREAADRAPSPVANQVLLAFLYMIIQTSMRL